MKTLIRLVCATLGGSMLFALVPAALAQAGSTDTNYLANADGTVRSVALQPDGKLLIAGEFRLVGGVTRQAIARLNSDGSLDSKFETGIDWGWAQRVLHQADGKIIVAGSLGRQGTYLPRLLRLWPSGARDTNFVADPWPGDWYYALASQPDGKLLIASDSGLCRMMTDGRLDTNFAVMRSSQWQTNEDGSVTSARIALSSLAVLADGKILVGGNFQGVFGKPVTGLIRLNPDGTRDSLFTPATNWVAECLAVQPDGKILSGGSALYGNGQVRRFHPDGQPDSAFLSEPVFAGHLKSLSIQRDGKIIAAGGFSDVSGLPRRHVARLNSDGSLDRGFASNVPAEISALAIQSDGAVLVAGGFDKGVMQLLGDDLLFPGWFEFTLPIYQVNESAGSVVVPVCRYGGSNGTTTVKYATLPGSATEGLDFVPRSGTLTFAPGQTSNFFAVPIREDTLYEGYPDDERIGLSLSAPTGGAVLGSLDQAIISITDNDCRLAFASSSYSGLEAAGKVAVSVARSGYPGLTVSVACVTSNLSATAGLDYLGGTIIFTLGPGETNKTHFLTLLDDGLAVREKQFAISLRQPLGATLGSPSTAVVRIVDDAPGAPDPNFVAEAGYSSVLAVCAGGDFFSLPFNIARCHADGTLDTNFHQPPQPSSYLRTMALQPDGKIVVARGSSQGPFRLNADGSRDTSFVAGLTRDLDYIGVQTDGKLIVGARNYSPGLARLNSDGAVDATFQPGVLAGQRILAILIQPDGRIVCSRIPEPGQASQASLVRLQPDGALDPAFNAPFLGADRIESLAVQTDGKILAGGQLSSAPASYRNGLVRLQPDGSLDNTFSSGAGFSESSGLAVQAGNKLLMGSYGAVRRLNPDGSIDPSFDTGLGPWDGFGLRTVSAIGLQPDGGVLVSGGFHWMNGIACPGMARLQNDEHSAAGEISLILHTPALLESAGNILVRVSRTGGSNGVVVVPFSTIDGTARAGLDYLPQSGVVTFADGDSGEKLITIPVLADTLPEGDEHFSFSLGTPVGGAVWGRPAKVTPTIVDEDVAIEFAQTKGRAYEYSLGETVVVQRLGQTATAVSVDYTTADGTALAGFDYVARQGRLEFGPGETNKSIRIAIIDEELAESDETLNLVLTNASAGVVVSNNASALTIIDDDHAGMLDPRFDAGSALCLATVYGSTRFNSLALQADGRVLAGGNFQYLNGHFIQGLVRFLDEGPFDPEFTPQPVSGPAPVVQKIALQADGKAVFATQSNDGTSDRCQRLLTNGLPDPSFGPVSLNRAIASGTLGRLQTLAVQGSGKILIAGAFVTVNGIQRYNIARLNPNGSLDSSFIPPRKSSPYTYPELITCMASIPGGKVMIGGKFIFTNIAKCYGLARLNANGSFDATFNPGTGIANVDGPGVPWKSASAYAIAVQPDGRILVGGEFMRIRGAARTNIARLNPGGSLDTTFKPSISWEALPGLARVWTIVLQPDGKILVGGQFDQVNGKSRFGIARLLADGSLDHSFSSGDPGYSIPIVRSIVLEPQGGILVGGEFDGFGGFQRCGIARLHGTVSSTPYDGHPWFTSLRRDITGAATLNFIAKPGQAWSVYATADLVHWLRLGPSTEIGNGYFSFQDNEDLLSARFYRIVSP